MSLNHLIALPSHIHLPSVGGAQRWWKRLTPHRQDRVAMLAPLAAVLLFFAAIVSALGYLRVEEIEREQQAVRRDVEYAQQRVRLLLLERQEQLMRMARELSNRELDATDFRVRAAAMLDLGRQAKGQTPLIAVQGLASPVMFAVAETAGLTHASLRSTPATLATAAA